MDLLRHYSTSDSEESNNHHDSQHQRQEHQQDEIITCKKKRRITSCESSNDTNTLSKAKIAILSSPQERTLLNPKNAFERNRPHIQGNWSGNIYISLKPNISSATTATAANFERRNSEAYKRFKRFAYSTIMNFQNRIATFLNVRNEVVGDNLAIF